VRAALITIDDDVDDEPADKSGRVRTRALDVLVAEDNRTNQRVIAKILERGGHRVRIVDNGEEALDALEAQWFDFVLMDLNMPVMSGLDAIRMYRFEHADDPQPPFVALTADATASMRKACLDAGFSAFVTKPIEANKLLALIDDITASDDESDINAAPTDDAGFGANVLIHPRAVGGRPVLEASKIESLRQLDSDPAFLSELIDEFISDAESLIDDMDAAYTNLQVTRFRDQAHALRSSAAHLGATAVFELCLAWRGIGADELKHDGGRHMARLRQEFDRLRAALLAEKGDTTQTGRRA
jgi:two-component system sensor histidine kinase RpfC